MQPFINFDDMMRYINGVVAMYRDRAVSAHCVEMNIVDLNCLRTGQHLRRCAVTDPDLNLHTFNLGYMNYRRGINTIEAHYISRTPVRKIKQGLYPNNLVCETLRIDNGILYSSAFAAMLENKYPPYEEAYRYTINANSARYSKAFSKNLALSKVNNRIEMLFQGTPIMLYNAEYDKWLWYPGLNASHSYYELMIERAGVKNLEVY